MGFLFRVMKMFSCDAAEHCEYTKDHEVAQFNMVNYTLCESFLSHTKIAKKQQPISDREWIHPSTWGNNKMWPKSWNDGFPDTGYQAIKDNGTWKKENKTRWALWQPPLTVLKEFPCCGAKEWTEAEPRRLYEIQK